MLTKPHSCANCALEQRGTGYAPAVGPPTAPLLFVGESLGSDEARLGEPFVGMAGGMLNRLLARNLWDRSSFRIDNVCRCQPPGNWFDERAPYYQQARAQCTAAHLSQTLAEPHRIIVSLGGTALKTLLGIDKGIRVEDWHGTITQLPSGQLLVPTFHPSFLVRGATNLFGVVCFDLQVAQRAAKDGWQPDPAVAVVDPPPDWFEAWVGQVEAACQQDPSQIWLAVDIETPDKSGGQDEGSLTAEDQSYQIQRVNFSVHPDEGVTVPYAGPYVALVDRLLRLACPKLGWNCPTPDQRVLTEDLKWIPAGDLKVGDRLIGFDEAVPGMRRTRRYRTATVTHAARRSALVYAVHLSDGSVVKVTGEHRWLIKPVRGPRRRHYAWTPTTDLIVGQKVQRLFHAWDVGTSRDHGYLAGFFDGEGSLSGQTVTGTLRVSMAQTRGPTLDYVSGLLHKLKVPFGAYPISREKDKHCVGAHLLGRTADIARFLGEVRPQRLLSKFRSQQLGALQAWRKHDVTVTAIESLGVCEIVALSTDTHTYVLEGYGAHNCEYDRPRLEASGHVIAGDFYDFMWAAHHLQSDVPLGLGFWAPFYSRFGAWKHLATGQPGLYAAYDGFQTYRTATGIAADLEAQGMWYAFEQHTHRVHRYALRPAQQVGVKIDVPRLTQFIHDLEVTQRRLLHEMQGLVPAELRPLTPKGGYKREPEEGRVHAKGTAIKRDGTAKKEEPDPLKQELYALHATIVHQRVRTLTHCCDTCGAVDVGTRHRCPDGPATRLREVELDRWFWQEPFNPDSPDQILAYLKAKGHKPGKAKKTHADSTDRETLQRLAKETKDPLYAVILKTRAVGKVRGTYGEGTRKRLDAEGRIHPVPTYRPSTHRLSYVNPNITNVIADKGGKENLAAGFRACVVATDQDPAWAISGWADRFDA